MTRARKDERMARVRLAAVIEKLHGEATDPATGEERGRQAAAELGSTVLRHMELIVQALKDAGK